MNVTQAEFDRLARQHGHRYAFQAYPYSLVFKYDPEDHNSWVLYFSTQESRQAFAANLRACGGVVTGASHGDTSGLQRAR